MKNKAQVWIGVVLTLLILGACQSASLEKKDVWVADVRSAMEQNTPFSMKDDVMGIEYIPLETRMRTIWVNIPFISSLTRLRKRFKALTGWQKQTNEHGRDGAMLVYGF